MDIANLTEVFEQLQVARAENVRLAEHFNDRNENLSEVVILVQNAVFDVEDQIGALQKRIEQRAGQKATQRERSKLEELRLRKPILWNLRNTVAQKRDKLNDFVDATESLTALVDKAIKTFQGASKVRSLTQVPYTTTSTSRDSGAQPPPRPSADTGLEPTDGTVASTQAYSEPPLAAQSAEERPNHRHQGLYSDPLRQPQIPLNSGQLQREKNPETVANLKKTKADLREAETTLLKHWTTYEDQFEAYKLEHAHHHDEDLRSEFSPVYISRGRGLAERVATAERNVQIAKRIAKENRVPNTSDQESHFVSDPNEGVDREYQEEAEMYTDMENIEKWKKSDKTTDYKRTASEANFHECGRLKDAEISDSISALEDIAHKKRKIVAWERNKPRPFEIAPVEKPPEADGISKPSDFDDEGNAIMADASAISAVPNFYFEFDRYERFDILRGLGLDAENDDKVHTRRRRRQRHRKHIKRGTSGSNHTTYSSQGSVKMTDCDAQSRVSV
ncbi:hypothetical protein BDV96DRAFT_644472 [Lophiotrema nucula]|uniref:Uncharacterized protein n=1 Tax=Lophiotrema nucula TaxID=690887 RepID=A0A6A5ZE80_9PLEO|nr:hypothetical protein BDV96DRAFT_644472 [Lophiotrema nucula]